MPQVTITASSEDAVPSMQQFQIWIQTWSQAAPGGVWGQPLTKANVATISVKNLSVEQIADVIRLAITIYNLTHPGNNTITVVVE